MQIKNIEPKSAYWKICFRFKYFFILMGVSMNFHVRKAKKNVKTHKAKNIRWLGSVKLLCLAKANNG